MPIQFPCPCGRKLQAADEHVGRRIKCPACGHEMDVPNAAEVAVKPAEAVEPRPVSVQVEAPRPEKGEDFDDDRPRHGPRRWGDDDEDDEDRAPIARTTSHKAVVALVLGLFSVPLSILAGGPAIILAVQSLTEIRKSRGRLGGQGAAIVGLILGVLSCVVLIGALPVLLMIPAVEKTREAANRIHVHNNLKQMVLAMHSYNMEKGHLPEAEPDPKLKGPTKMSWRVAIMPYVEADNLYATMHHDEPWDSPHNKAFLTSMPMIFYHPLHPEENAQGLTYYRVFVGDHTAFPPGKVLRIAADFPDGTSNTILIVEAADPVPWTKPDELVYDPAKPLPKIGGHFATGTNAALADGSTHVILRGVSEGTLRNAIDPADGLPLGPDW